jgi:Methyltransferase domain
MSPRLSRSGLGSRPVSVDVRPFRRACGPYVTYDGIRLPFGDAAFDTTLVLLVLHHCSKPETVLERACTHIPVTQAVELRRRSSRRPQGDRR